MYSKIFLYRIITPFAAVPVIGSYITRNGVIKNGSFKRRISLKNNNNLFVLDSLVKSYIIKKLIGRTKDAPKHALNEPINFLMIAYAWQRNKKCVWNQARVIEVWNACKKYHSTFAQQVMKILLFSDKWCSTKDLLDIY